MIYEPAEPINIQVFLHNTFPKDHVNIYTLIPRSNVILKRLTHTHTLSYASLQKPLVLVTLYSSVYHLIKWLWLLLKHNCLET